MPKFVYIKTQFGVEPQIFHDDSVFGVTGKCAMNVVQAHDINDNEAEFSLHLLSTIYPYLEVKDASDQ